LPVATVALSIMPIPDHPNGIDAALTARSRVIFAAMPVLALIAPAAGYLNVVDSVRAEGRSAGSRPAAPVPLPSASQRARPDAAESPPEPDAGSDLIARQNKLPEDFRRLARASGEPQIPGLAIIYLAPLGNLADANKWRNIIVHQTEGPAGSAKSLALAQAKNPSKRGVTLWVEVDGTVYWSTAETAIPTHGDGANRNDNKYIDNSKTYRSVIKTNSIGVEFVGNYPDVSKPASPAQVRAWLVLVRFLQERYEITAEHIYAHNWIDYKDHRYCEGCELAALARKLAHAPGKSAQR
jgi:N-acetylmuramoyl-L-alanine amidase